MTHVLVPISASQLALLMLALDKRADSFKDCPEVSSEYRALYRYVADQWMTGQPVSLEGVAA